MTASLLGCALGFKSIPSAWVKELCNHEELLDLGKILSEIQLNKCSMSSNNSDQEVNENDSKKITIAEKCGLVTLDKLVELETL